MGFVSYWHVREAKHSNTIQAKYGTICNIIGILFYVVLCSICLIVSEGTACINLCTVEVGCGAKICRAAWCMKHVWFWTLKYSNCSILIVRCQKSNISIYILWLSKGFTSLSCICRIRTTHHWRQMRQHWNPGFDRYICLVGHLKLNKKALSVSSSSNNFQLFLPLWLHIHHSCCWSHGAARHFGGCCCYNSNLSKVLVTECWGVSVSEEWTLTVWIL